MGFLYSQPSRYVAQWWVTKVERYALPERIPGEYLYLPHTGGKDRHFSEKFRNVQEVGVTPVI